MSADAKSPVTICVPDDFPSVFDKTQAHERCRKVGDTRVFTARGADDEAELIQRIDTARIAINIRAHARFTDRVMEACRKLEQEDETRMGGRAMRILIPRTIPPVYEMRNNRGVGHAGAEVDPAP